MKMKKYPKLFDYENQVIMAGGIDTNMALSPCMDQWDYIK